MAFEITGSRQYFLRPLLSSDTDWLYSLSISAGTSWRYAARTPSPTEFFQQLWSGIHAQFMVCERSTERSVGLVGTYRLNLEASHVHMFAVGTSSAPSAAIEGAGLLVEWVFGEMDLDKIWFEATELSFRAFASFERFCTVEARLANYAYAQGRFFDLIIMSLTRSQWEELRPVLDTRLAARPRSASAPNSRHRRQVIELIEELWPMDSLSIVELSAALEESGKGTWELGALAQLVRGATGPGDLATQLSSVSIASSDD